MVGAALSCDRSSLLRYHSFASVSAVVVVTSAFDSLAAEIV